MHWPQQVRQTQPAHMPASVIGSRLRVDGRGAKGGMPKLLLQVRDMSIPASRVPVFWTSAYGLAYALDCSSNDICVCEKGSNGHMGHFFYLLQREDKTRHNMSGQNDQYDPCQEIAVMCNLNPSEKGASNG